MELSLEHELLIMQHHSEDTQLVNYVRKLKEWESKIYNENIKNHDSVSKSIDNIINYVKQLEINLNNNQNKSIERINRHHSYFEGVYKKIIDFEKYNEMVATQNMSKDRDLYEEINRKDAEIQKIKLKQVEQDLQILELQKLVKSLVKEPSKLVEEPESPILQGTKRKLNSVTDNYIQKLIASKNKAKPWSTGMSKYVSISQVNNKWRWETTIFNENYKNFNTKEEAEKYYESVLEKYDIDTVYITRVGYKFNL